MTGAEATLVPTDRASAMAHARTAYDRFAVVVESLEADDWARSTDCDEWTVRELVGHVVGAMRAAASLGELFSQQREIKRLVRSGGGNETDVMTQVQIDRTAGRSIADLAHECRALVEPATKGRARTPGLMRRFVTFPVEMGAIDETWSLGYLVDVVLTRDAWLHRIDLCRALGREPLLTADHDGHVVAEVVDEWGRRHGQPYRLALSGIAGGTYRGDDTTAERAIELDAVEFCRILSGRAPGAGLLSTPVPF